MWENSVVLRISLGVEEKGWDSMKMCFWEKGCEICDKGEGFFGLSALGDSDAKEKRCLRFYWWVEWKGNWKLTNHSNFDLKFYLWNFHINLLTENIFLWRIVVLGMKVILKSQMVWRDVNLWLVEGWRKNKVKLLMKLIRNQLSLEFRRKDIISQFWSNILRNSHWAKFTIFEMSLWLWLVFFFKLIDHRKIDYDLKILW